MNKEFVLNGVNELEDYMMKTRRYLHQHPEVSSKEYETSAFLKREVRKFGLPVYDVENSTGFYAVLDTQRPGKTIGLRTDIDALPVTEKKVNLKGERTCLSHVEGVMHACGHDGHMAVVLASIQFLIKIKDQLNGKVVFIFEEGEEIGSGIHQMVAALKPLNMDAIYGTHLAAFMDTGTISIEEGPQMTGAIMVEFDLVGRGGHGSRPDLSINPVFAMANVLTGLASAWVNQIDVSKTVTLGLTQFQAGTAYNVFPDCAFVGGSLRYFDYDEGKKALEIFKNVTTKIAEAHLCKAVFRESTAIATIPVINDEALSKIARDGARELYGDKVIHGAPWYASESFSLYSKLCPTTFAFVGCKNEDVGSGADHHNEYFDIDEASLSYSLGSTLMFAINLLSNQD